MNPSTQQIRHSLSECTIRRVLGRDRKHVRRLLAEGLLPGDTNDAVCQGLILTAGGRKAVRECAWVAEACGTIIGTIALVEVSLHTAHLRRLRVMPQWQMDHSVARMLVRTAVEHARQVGFLKLIFNVPTEAEAQVVSFLHLLRFELSRCKCCGARHVLEFYLNFYEARREPLS